MIIHIIQADGAFYFYFFYAYKNTSSCQLLVCKHVLSALFYNGESVEIAKNAPIMNVICCLTCNLVRFLTCYTLKTHENNALKKKACKFLRHVNPAYELYFSEPRFIFCTEMQDHQAYQPRRSNMFLISTCELS